MKQIRTVRSTGLSKFKLQLKEMRHIYKYKNYDFDYAYALKYSLDIADKYHFLSLPESLVHHTKPTVATAQAKHGKAPRKDTDEEKGIFGQYKH